MFGTGGVPAASIAAQAHMALVAHVGQVGSAIACGKDTLCFQMVQGIPSAMVALTVGIVGAYIAWRQYATARAKLKLDLFTLRYELFMAVWTHLSHIKQIGAEVKESHRSQYEAYKNFRNNLPQAGFLFGKDIERYLEEIDKNQFDLWGLELKLEKGGLDQAEAAQREALKTWFDQEARTAKNKFKPYLDLRNWK